MKLIKNILFDDNNGFGDFLRGSISLYEICSQKKYRLELDYSKHTISNFLINFHHTDIEFKSQDIHIFAVEHYDKLINLITNTHDNHILVATNVWNFRGVDMDCKKFIRESIYPNPYLTSRINFYMNQLGIEEKKYSVIHVRNGDYKIKKEVNRLNSLINFDDILFKINNKLKETNNNDKIILISDDTEFKKYACSIHNWLSLDLDIGHIAIHNKELNKIEHTLIDFFLISKSSTVIQHTVYSWPSGFSRWCAEIYDIPFIKLDSSITFF